MTSWVSSTGRGVPRPRREQDGGGWSYQRAGHFRWARFDPPTPPGPQRTRLQPAGRSVGERGRRETTTRRPPCSQYRGERSRGHAWRQGGTVTAAQPRGRDGGDVVPREFGPDDRNACPRLCQPSRKAAARRKDRVGRLSDAPSRRWSRHQGQPVRWRALLPGALARGKSQSRGRGGLPLRPPWPCDAWRLLQARQTGAGLPQRRTKAPGQQRSCSGISKPRARCPWPTAGPRGTEERTRGPRHDAREAHLLGPGGPASGDSFRVYPWSIGRCRGRGRYCVRAGRSQPDAQVTHGGADLLARLAHA